MHEVSSAADKRKFLEMPALIYKNDPRYIRPLDKDINDVFDPAKNKCFRHGDCSRWLLLDDAGAAIGRVAVFINNKYRQQQPTGGIGFFECIDDQQAADIILDHCRDWLKARGMEAMDGPINFGERDRWWGLQTEGFQEPLYCMNYNPAYYRQLLEHYGFREYFGQVCYGMRTTDSLSEQFFTRHDQVARDPGYTVQRIRKSELERFAQDFTVVYNKAWAAHGENKQLEFAVVKKMFRAMKPVMDKDLIWFAYYKDEPVAMFVNLPDLNQYFRKMNGRFGLLQKLYFLLLQTFGKCYRFVGLVFGVVPEHQGKGVDAYLIVEASKVLQQKPRYETYEMQWIGDFNPRMLHVAESLGAKPTRRLATYRYLFDRSKPFERHPVIGSGMRQS